MVSVEADLDVCQGFANCVMNAPDLFDIDDNDMVVILTAEVPDEQRAYVEHAVHSCPVSALSIDPE